MSPYTHKKLPAVLITLFLAIALPLIVLNAQKSQSFFSLAKEKAACEQIPLEEPGKKPDVEKVRGASSALRDANEQLQAAIAAYKDNRNDENAKRIQELAQSRKQFLLSTMRHNPDEAHPVLLSDQQQPEITEITQNCTATETTIEGSLAVLHADFVDDTSTTWYELQTDSGEKVHIHPARGLKTPLTTGMRIKAKGLKIDNDMLIDGSNPDSIQILSTETSRTLWQKLFGGLLKKAHAAISSSLGPKRAAVLLVNFQNTTQPGLTRETAAGSMTAVNNFYKEATYNKTTFEGTLSDVYGWYQLPTDHTCSIGLSSTAVAQADPDVDFNQYSHVIIVAPFRQINDCGWAGLAYIGNVSVTTAEGRKTMGVSMVAEQYMTSGYMRVASHELGHNLGLHHATFYNCVDVSIKESGCTEVEYGDRYAMMGSGNNGHFNAGEKDYVGWFNPGNIQTVNNSGTFVLEPYETNTSGLKALKIPRSASEYLFVEYRQPNGVGFDTGLLAEAFNGALIHTRDYRSRLIDPSAPISGNNTTAALKPGETFTDPLTNTSISIASKTSTALTVQVTFNGPTGAPTNTPAATATPSPTRTPTPIPPTNTPTPTVDPLATPTPTPIVDTTKPTSSITSPLNNAIVTRRSNVTVNATASDNVGVDRVVFSVGGNVSTDYSAPYSYVWSVPGAPNKTYTIKATAYDAAGNSAVSQITVKSNK